MHNTPSGCGTRAWHCAPALALLTAAWLSSAVAADAPPVAADPTGKITRSPVLGPRADDGTLGGIIPSAVPGWTPNPSDGKDAYVYVPQVGWRLGDTPEERATLEPRSSDGSAPRR